MILRNLVRKFGAAPPKEIEPLSKTLRNRIKFSGPITVAHYMKEVLTNAGAGYYMNRDVFGERGDFITSPELNQAFGEMIGIWLLNEWSKVNRPDFQLVELGPGRGTLSQDITRIFDKYRIEYSLNLVEISPFLSSKQAELLCVRFEDTDGLTYKRGITKNGIPVSWYRNLNDVPDKFSLIIAHEFFDALPIHKFVRTDRGYREILIDVDGDKFRYVIARNETPASLTFIRPDEERRHVEISPQGLIVAKNLSGRLKSFGGIALIADYGHFGEDKDSFRAFKRHRLHDPLIDPGSADLTADVDFRALTEALRDGTIPIGPVTQSEFLTNMGIERRLETLKKNATEDQREALDWGYRIMTDGNEMGERFKMVAAFPSVLKNYLDKVPVSGFHSTRDT